MAMTTKLLYALVSLALLGVGSLAGCSSDNSGSGGGTSTGGSSTGGSSTGGSSTGGSGGSSATGGTSSGGSGGGTCIASGDSCAEGGSCCSGLQCCVGVPVPPGQEYCSATCPKSDVNIKRDFQSIDPNAILERIEKLPISSWSYKTEDPKVRHIGPMAQDFKAAFGVGASDKTILQVDADGVALSAIQALNKRLQKLEKENAELTRRVEGLTADCKARPAM